MPKLIISIDGVVLREVELTQERTTLGRRPYNDIVIDHLTISGEHALLHLNGSGAVARCGRRAFAVVYLRWASMTPETSLISEIARCTCLMPLTSIVKRM